MKSTFPLFPDSASALSGRVDLLYVIWVLVSLFFTVLIAGLIVFFMFRYRRRHFEEVGADERAAVWLEILWSAVPLVIMLFMCAWGMRVFFELYRPPADAVEYTAIGKQWMWKVQHPEGVREINEMHVPVGRPVRVSLGSEDVLHDYFIPAFRVKMDAVPGKVTTLWFEATEVGTYHIFCAEYCGTKHSGMIGQVIVMTPQDYEAWLAGGKSTGTAVQNGERLFTDLACVTCHKPDSSGRGPSLLGVFGSTVTLADGRKVVADENYLRESIMNSQAKIVAGYQGIMPTFQGMVTEENLLQLIAYIKTLKPAAPAGGQGK
jgi:cytochrome c oxidase subunit II